MTNTSFRLKKGGRFKLPDDRVSQYSGLLADAPKCGGY